MWIRKKVIHRLEQMQLEQDVTVYWTRISGYEKRNINLATLPTVLQMNGPK